MNMGMKGAEAVLRRMRILGIPCVEKFRLRKDYRTVELDSKIRRERTRREARLLHAAKSAGAFCPAVLEVGEYFIRMEYLRGEMLYHALRRRKVRQGEISEAARILLQLHSANIIHGDFTPANLMGTRNGMAVFDFGLGSISTDNEDKATDIVTMKKALGAQGQRFVSAYLASGGKPSIVRMVAEIEGRARYMERV
jgi:Kae1-associated kinase Bud32